MNSTKWLIIVRRGDTEQFERLKTQFADNQDATVRFARRVGPRRTRKKVARQTDAATNAGIRKIRDC